MEYKPDCLIIGGGIAGLWLLSRLRDAGADAWLLEKNALGSGQTLAAQGIIHSGIKYSLGSAISTSTKAIATMPDRWKLHMQGKQLPQLTRLRVLSDKHYLITSANIPGKLTKLLASKMLPGSNTQDTTKTVKLPDNLTSIAIEEDIIDTRSLIEQLHQRVGHTCRQYCLSREHLRKSSGHWSVEIEGNTIIPRLLILAAGEGNAEYIGNRMQLRPLHMVYLRHQDLFPIYAHFIEAGNSKPVCTISSHYDDQGNLIWYLGGDIAETGLDLYSGQQCIRAEQVLRRLWTHIDWGFAQWNSFMINRAEYKSRNFLRPKSPDIYKCSKNAIAVFPTKLTFTPLLADMVLKEYQRLPHEQSTSAEPILSTLPLAQPGRFPWSID